MAVEADWPDAAVYDAYVRGLPRPKVPRAAFTRFPTWMWRNGEVANFLKRLKAINEGIGVPDRRCGFYGLDVYSLSASIEAVLNYLDKVDPESARDRARALWLPNALALRPGALWAHGSLARLCGVRKAGRRRAARSPQESPRLSRQGRRGVFQRRTECAHRDGGRAILPGDVLWRRHVVEFARPTYVRHAGATSVHRGPGSKAVVWAHNSHIGNAEFTEMGQVRGEHNIGQLARDRFGDAAALIGFGTDRGTVAAASNWDGPMEIKRVRPGRDDSYEGSSRDAGIPSFFLEIGPGQKKTVRDALAEPLLERAIGVIYRPETELLSHYFQAELSRQFDAWIWFAETQAVSAQRKTHRPGPDETYPFGL